MSIENSVKFSSVKVRSTTLKRVSRYGRKGDSYEDIILRMLDLIESPDWSKKARSKISVAMYQPLK